MKILCVGDYIEDQYVFGTATRLCPEAPVPVVIPEIERTTAGGVGLVEAQLRELGAEVTAWYGSRSIKRRIFGGSHLLLRIDHDSLPFEPEPFPDQALRECDAVIVSDYDKGAMFREIADELRKSGKPLYVDCKHGEEWYRNHDTWYFPNEAEAAIMDYFSECPVVKKLGAKGCSFGDIHIPAAVTDVVDTCGAGDIFIAAFAWAQQSGRPDITSRVSSIPTFTTRDCLEFANQLAGESCRHRGTFVVGREFAQGVAERIRRGARSEQPVPDLDVRSISGRFEFPSLRHLKPIFDARVERESGNLPEDSFRDATDQGVILKTDDSWQTPRILPSDPKGSSDVPIPERIDLEPSSKPPWEG